MAKVETVKKDSRKDGTVGFTEHLGPAVRDPRPGSFNYRMRTNPGGKVIADRDKGASYGTRQAVSCIFATLGAFYEPEDVPEDHARAHRQLAAGYLLGQGKLL